MTIDARTIPKDSVIQCDVCVVGGGPAGITIAREFVNKNYSVCLLESGGLGEVDAATESLREGENIGLDYFPIRDLTARTLGGNSSRWASFLTPFEDIDFEKRDWVPYSGWPFTKQTLIPYYERANQICGVGEFNYAPEHLAASTQDESFKVMPLQSQRIQTKAWKFHLPPLNWKDAYLGELEQAANIDIYLYANVVEIEVNDAVKQVDRVRVACINQNQFWVSSRMFVLAMGGVETPRVLLASNRVQNTGVGNQNDLVGRFFLEHPHFYRSSLVMIIDPDDYPALYTWEAMTRYKVLAALGPTRQMQEEEQILNGSVELANATNTWGNTTIQKGFIADLGAVLEDLKDLTARSLRNNLFRSWFGIRSYRRRLLEFHPRHEQAPNPDSRIILSTERDPLGLNRIKLDWRLTELDRRTLHRIDQAIAEEVGKAGLGRVQINYSETDPLWPPVWQNLDGPSFGGGWHYMGTTRMHIDPKQGVVDENCRVHGISNLYIASSSVFPTVSFANPTLTIVALALRLCEHLESRLRQV
jgi:choline dehydrogenase-like flavoprotein